MRGNRWSRRFRKFTTAVDRAARADTDVLLSAFLASEKRKLIARNGGSVRARQAAKRKARSLRTNFLRRFSNPDKARRKILRQPSTLLFRVRPDLVRDSLCPEFHRAFVPIRSRLNGRNRQQISWRDMSFARDPRGAMQKLASLAMATAKAADLRLNFMDADCDDVTPYIVLAHLYRALPPIIGGGKITHEVADVITSVGLQSGLRIGSIDKGRNAKDYSVSAFRMCQRTPPGTFGDKDRFLRPQFKELVADQFVNTLNGWIAKHDLELTEAAAGNFVGAIGEALDNAERHGEALDGNREGDWSIAAFSRLTFAEDGAPLLRCSVGIVSVGSTISESLESAADEVKAKIDDYARRHTPLLRSTGDRRDALRTVVALQDGVTRDPAATRDRRGGVGFMELIEVFSEMGDNARDDLPCVLTIISGKVCLRITSPYGRGEKKDDGLRQLWFNTDNVPDKAPSNDHVLVLDHAFPGVILSACFTIDPGNLRKKLDGASAHDRGD